MEAEKDYADTVDDPLVMDQTRRMFKYMLGIIGEDSARFKGQEPREKKPPLRLVQLLDTTFDIMEKQCDARFVATQFLRDVKNAFYFILSEALPNIEDVSIDDYETIDGHLKACLSYDVFLYFNGTRCRGRSKVRYFYFTLWNFLSSSLSVSQFSPFTR